MSFDLDHYLCEQRERVNLALGRLIPHPETEPARVHQAMRYSLEAGGKRLRSILCLAAATAVGGDEAAVMPAACALECIHTYSLIHDDLPAMDDDDLRRGRPTNHKVFGEAIAILAGDALLTEAFRLLVEPLAGQGCPERQLRAVGELSAACGSRGLVGGQVMDIQWERGQISGDEVAILDYIHRHKTGDLLTVSVRMGAILSGADEGELSALTAYARRLGLAYQIADDLLDLTGAEGRLGKRVQKDAAHGKLTYPGVHGVAESRRKNAELLAEALRSLEPFGQRAEPLRALAPFLVNRDY